MTRSEQTFLRVATAGSVDDGKSTLIGRLLYESQSVYADQVADAKRATSNASVTEAGEELDYSLLCDGLKAEREQGITIDVAYRYFSTPRRKFVIADTPGHIQYTRNMATGASSADLSLLLVDARTGLTTQSKRHAFISTLFGVRHMLVCVNKMDLVGYAESAFREIQDAFKAFAGRLDLPDLRFVPVCALRGDNVTRSSANMPWYQGPPLLRLLETIHCGSDRNMIDLRFPVQSVIRSDQDFRGYSGQVASGILRAGDEVVALPSGQRTHVSRIVTFDGDLEQAYHPQSVTLCLQDALDLGRGDMLVRPRNQPHMVRGIDVMLVWLSSDPLSVGGSYLVKHTTQTVRAEVERLDYVIDVDTLSRRDEPQLDLNAIGRVQLSLHQPLFVDSYRRNRVTGRLILIDPRTNATVGAALVVDRLPASVRPLSKAHQTLVEDPTGFVTQGEQEELLGQRALTVWFTGLSGSGKSTLARALQRALHDQGRLVSILDGDIVRGGLSHGLGFSTEERNENVRRVAHAARLLNRAGVIVIASLISPLEAQREAAREILGVQHFVVIHVATPVEECRRRDPKGLYARADSGELEQFTGVSAPYEAPAAPDLVLDAGTSSVKECLESLLATLRSRLAL